MNGFLKGCLLATGFGFVAVPVAASANDGDGTITPSDFRLSTGVSYSSGDYGEIEDTEVFAVPVSLTYKKDGLKIRVSVPWVHVDGPGSLISTPEGRDGGSGQGQGRGRGRGGDSDNSGSGSSNRRSRGFHRSAPRRRVRNTSNSALRSTQSTSPAHNCAALEITAGSLVERT